MRAQGCWRWWAELEPSILKFPAKKEFRKNLENFLNFFTKTFLATYSTCNFRYFNVACTSLSVDRDYCNTAVWSCIALIRDNIADRTCHVSLLVKDMRQYSTKPTKKFGGIRQTPPKANAERYRHTDAEKISSGDEYTDVRRFAPIDNRIA